MLCCWTLKDRRLPRGLFKHPLLYVWIVWIGAMVGAGLLKPTSDMQGIVHAQNEGQQTQAQESSAKGTGEEPRPSHYAADCNKPKDHAAADLCQQIRMADAAEAQNRLNAFNLGALIATLLVSAGAAYAAWRTVVAMKDTAQHQLRAYVSLHSVKAIDLLGENPRFVVTFKNSGQTPALGFRANCYVRAGNFHITDFSPRALAMAPSVSILGAQDTNSVPLPAPYELPDEHKEGLRNGSVAIYVFGEAMYKDIFDRPHMTRFRVMCGGNTGVTSGELANCPEGNDAD
jgi:hypothetical protein